MNYFWDEEVPFIELFDLHYNFYIFLMVILVLLIITQYKWIRDNKNKVWNWILAISILQQIALYSWYIFEMGFDVSESLPLHISRISSILGIIFLITKNKKILNVLFYFGLFAYGSFFYPSRVYPIYHLIGQSFFINHAITILVPVVAMIVTDWRPTLKAAYKSYAWFLIYFFFVYFLNPFIDGNYFYLKHRPFFAAFPDYIYVPLVLVATFVLFLSGHFTAKGIEKLIYRYRRRYISEA